MRCAIKTAACFISIEKLRRNGHKKIGWDKRRPQSVQMLG